MIGGFSLKKIKIHHFGGKNICATWDEVAQALEQTVDGSNEFFIVAEHTMFPHLVVLVRGNYAHVYCTPNDMDGSLLAFSGDALTDLPSNGISIFYFNAPTEEIQICNDYVIPKTLAWDVVKDFVETGEMSSRVQWDAL